MPQSLPVGVLLVLSSDVSVLVVENVDLCHECPCVGVVGAVLWRPSRCVERRGSCTGSTSHPVATNRWAVDGFAQVLLARRARVASAAQ